jgi:hypothetical protein
MRLLVAAPLALLSLAVPSIAFAKTIDITPADDWTKIEAALPGDVVEIESGTYKFLVHLDQKATEASPITIRAKDPTHPPVWDLTGITLDTAPGSSTTGDRGRGCWQVFGDFYDISGIVLQNCHNTDMNAAGLRYNGADGLFLHDVIFRQNDNGLTGIGNARVEFAEFDHNGNPAASAETHNMYIYDGDFTLRYSWVHDSTQGENFHLRCMTCLVEYNWFARANNYEGDMMPNYGKKAGLQKATFRGNVWVQKTAPDNHSQTFVMYNDSGATGLSMEMDFYWNTFIGNGTATTLVRHANAALDATKSDLSNNVIVGATNIFAYDDPSKATTSGSHNWLLASATSTGSLTGTITGIDPMLDVDHRPKSGSPLIGKADDAVTPLPGFEYFQNETVTRMYRVRKAAMDVGAFESTTTGPGVGPYGAPPDVDAGPTDSGGTDAAGDAKSDGGGADAITVRPDGDVSDGGDAGNGDQGSSSDSGGCGCRVSSNRSDDLALFVAGASLAIVVARRRRLRATRP